MKCQYCGNPRATQTSYGFKCNKCGIEIYENRRGNLHKRGKQSFISKIVTVILLKLCRFTKRLNQKVEVITRKHL